MDEDIDAIPFNSSDRLLSANGRIGRLSFFLRLLGLSAFLTGLGLFLIQTPSPEMGIIFVLLALPFMYFHVVQVVKRLHDLGHSGWFALITFVPALNGVFHLYLLLAPGTDGPNAHGAR